MEAGSTDAQEAASHAYEMGFDAYIRRDGQGATAHFSEALGLWPRDDTCVCMV